MGFFICVDPLVSDTLHWSSVKALESFSPLVECRYQLSVLCPTVIIPTRQNCLRGWPGWDLNVQLACRLCPKETCSLGNLSKICVCVVLEVSQNFLQDYL